MSFLAKLLRSDHISSFNKLPQELLIEIFTRLPLKTIVHLTCVCKSWNNLIKNPNFITSHLNRTVSDPKRTPLLLLRYHSDHDKKERFSIRYDDDHTFDEYKTLDSSYRIWPLTYYRIVGSCNGLICLSDDFTVLILWNPSIRKSFNVPIPLPTQVLQPNFVIGFGFDSWTSDFKVVRIVFFSDLDMRGLGVKPQVEVYELSTGMWRGSSGVVPSNVVINRHCAHVFVKGASHWVASKKGKEGIRHLIVSFHMGSEVFREMMLPASVAIPNGHKFNMSISLFRKSLCLLDYHGAFWGRKERCSVWVMKEYGVVESWEKLFVVDVGEKLNKVLGFRKNGEVLIEKSNRGLVLYDPESKGETRLGCVWSKDSSHLDTYTESLVLLDGKDQVSLNQAYIWNKLLKEE